MTDKLTDVMIAKAVQLVDDLCIVYCGYRTEDDHAVYRAADARIRKRAGEVHKAEEIKRLAARIEELKGNV